MHAITNASAQGHEHVFLVSDELEDVAPTSIDEELVQISAEGRLELSIFNGAYVSVRRSPARGRATDYWLNLAFLDPEPVRIQERIWLIGAAASAVAALAAWLLQGSASSEPVATGLAVLIPIAMVTAAGSLGIGLHRYFNGLHFLTRHGRAPVLRLEANKPDRQAVRRFTRRIAAAASAAHTRRGAVRSHYLRDEMKEHRRLREGEILDEKIYEAAKSRVLAAHG